MRATNIQDNYFVSPQIQETDLETIAQAGFKIIICNRPDEEVHEGLRSKIMKPAVEKAGMAFYFLPLTFENLTTGISKKQFDIVASTSAPVLAYCTTGSRCALLWALSKVNELEKEKILTVTANAGYNLTGLSDILTKTTK